MKTYKIRKFQNGKNKAGDPFINYSLTIPSAVAEALPEDMQFACELTDEGILFKPAQSEAETVQLPAWAKRENGNGAQASAQEPETAAEGEDETPKPRGRKRPGAKAAA